MCSVYVHYYFDYFIALRATLYFADVVIDRKIIITSVNEVMTLRTRRVRKLFVDSFITHAKTSTRYCVYIYVRTYLYLCIVSRGSRVYRDDT